MSKAKSYRAIAAYYDAEYAHVEMLHRDVPFFLRQLNRKRHDILEIACGTGRATIPMAQAGHRVVGFDYHAEMIEIAKRKRDGVGMTDRELKLRVADATKFNFAERFDRACVFFNTLLAFTTTESQDAVLTNIRRHLRPQGRLWIDVFNPDIVRLARESEDGIDPATFFVHSLGRSVHQTVDAKRSTFDQIMSMTFHYRWHDAEGEEKHERVAFDMTWIMPREMRLLLERNGFEIEQTFGDYDGSAVSDRSPRLIVQARLARRGSAVGRRLRG